MSNASTAAVAVPHATTPLHVVAGVPAAAAAEANRWMLGFGLPCLGASLLVAAAIGTGREWMIGGAILFLFAAIFAVIWLSISSDTNAHA